MEPIDYDKLLSEFYEESYEITLYNKKLGVSVSVPVFPSNTLKQVIEEYHDQIGIPSNQVSAYLKVLVSTVTSSVSGLTVSTSTSMFPRKVSTVVSG